MCVVDIYRGSCSRRVPLRFRRNSFSRPQRPSIPLVWTPATVSRKWRERAMFVYILQPFQMEVNFKFIRPHYRTLNEVSDGRWWEGQESTYCAVQRNGETSRLQSRLTSRPFQIPTLQTEGILDGTAQHQNRTLTHTLTLNWECMGHILAFRNATLVNSNYAAWSPCRSANLTVCVDEFPEQTSRRYWHGWQSCLSL